MPDMVGQDVRAQVFSFLENSLFHPGHSFASFFLPTPFSTSLLFPLDLIVVFPNGAPICSRQDCGLVPVWKLA